MCVKKWLPSSCDIWSLISPFLKLFLRSKLVWLWLAGCCLIHFLLLLDFCWSKYIILCISLLTPYYYSATIGRPLKLMISKTNREQCSHVMHDDHNTATYQRARTRWCTHALTLAGGGVVANGWLIVVAATLTQQEETKMVYLLSWSQILIISMILIIIKKFSY